jgi:hypothetical protein
MPGVNLSFIARKHPIHRVRLFLKLLDSLIWIVPYRNYPIENALQHLLRDLDPVTTRHRPTPMA